MRKTTALVALVLCTALAATACKKKDKEKKADKPATTDPATKKTDPPKGDPPKGTTANMINKMANCPSAVKGSETKVSTTDKAVVVTVTAADDAAKAEVVKRAKALSSFQGAKSDKVEHTGKGTGSGRLGKCPIMLDNVKLAVKEVDGGAEVTITPEDPKRLPALEHAAKARTRALTAGGNTRDHGSGMGGGGGKGSGGGRGDGNSKGDPKKADKKADPGDKKDDSEK